MDSLPPCPLPLPEQKRTCTTRSTTDHPPPPFTAEEAKAEASRCLSLAPCRGCEVCELICPDQAITKDPETGRPVIDLRYCKGCGLCAHLCPKGAIIMVQEES